MSTIMLVDDSATILLSISNILTKAGYAVEKASNAAEGLGKFKSGLKVDLLITDLNMPGMNGIEFIKEVRTLPNYKFMPILFLTTESQQAKRMEAKAAGASGWLQAVSERQAKMPVASKVVRMTSPVPGGLIWAIRRAAAWPA